MEVCPHCRNSFKRRGGLSLHFTWSSECHKVWQRTQHQDEYILFNDDSNSGEEVEQCVTTVAIVPPTPAVLERQAEEPTHHESQLLGASESIINRNELSNPTEYYGCTEEMWSFLPSTMEANDGFTTDTVSNTAPGFPISNIEGNAAIPTIMDGKSDTSSYMDDDDSDPWFGVDRYTVDEVLQIDLIRTLRTLKVPLKTYDAVMGWAQRAHRDGFKFGGNQPSRKTIMKKLFERHNLMGLQPKVKKLLLPYSQKVVEMIYFDAEAVFQSLLSCPILNHESNVLLNEDNPFTPPPTENPRIISEITTSAGYRKTYAHLIKDPSKEILFPCIFSIDKTQCDKNSRLSMEPLTISHGLLKHKIRRKPMAMRILGYINHTPDVELSAFDIKGKKTEDDQDSDDDGADDIHPETMPNHNLDKSVMTDSAISMNDYHAQIEFILKASGFLHIQKHGLACDIHHKGTVYRDTLLRLYVPFVIGDTEGHDYLCARYGSRSHGVAQICRACNCPTLSSGDENIKSRYKKFTEVDGYVKNKQLANLHAMSQHYVLNAFRLVRFGCHNNRGIFGACPGEILHLIQLGWFKYAMQSFATQAGPTSQAMSQFDDLCSVVGKLLQRQSYRNLPKTCLPKGFCAGNKLTGNENTGCLVVMLFALYTTGYREIFTAKTSNMREGGMGNEAHITDWITLLSSLLQWQEWLKQEEIEVRLVKKSTKAIKWLMSLMKTVAPREHGMRHNTIKFHLPLHLADDILDHGVPQNVNSAFAESAHIPLAKDTSRNTQKRQSTFTLQAAKRYVEDLAVHVSWTEANEEFTSNHDSPTAKGTEVGHTTLPGGKTFHAGFNTMSKVECQWGEWKANRAVNQKGNTHVILSRQSMIIIEEILKLIDSNTIPCYTEVKKSDGQGGWETYRAHPQFYGEQWNDFVLIKWSTDREPLPARLHTFLNLETCMNHAISLKSTNQRGLGPGHYAIVESFRRVEDDDDFSNTLIGRFKRDTHANTGKTQLYLADVDSFVRPIVGIPDVHIHQVNTRTALNQHQRRPKKRMRRDQRGTDAAISLHDHIFLVRPREEWPECWNSLIKETFEDNPESEEEQL